MYGLPIAERLKIFPACSTIKFTGACQYFFAGTIIGLCHGHQTTDPVFMGIHDQFYTINYTTNTQSILLSNMQHFVQSYWLFMSDIDAKILCNTIDIIILSIKLIVYGEVYLPAFWGVFSWKLVYQWMCFHHWPNAPNLQNWLYFGEYYQKEPNLAQIGCTSAENGILKGPKIGLFIGIAYSRHIHIQNLGGYPHP